MTTTTSRRLRRVSLLEWSALTVALGLVVRFAVPGFWARPAVATWTTVLVAICVQATPYVVLGVLVSAALAGFVPAGLIARVMPRRRGVAVIAAGVAGAALPGCECGSVPVAASLLRRGVDAAPAIAFLLAAPAVNPVVLVATSVAFPHRPVMVLARLLASYATAVVVGLAWLRAGCAVPVRGHLPHAGGRWRRAGETAAEDCARSLGLLVVGAACAATIEVVVPPGWLSVVAGSGLWAVVGVAALAVLVAVCSEADAFVAASFVRFSATAQLAFMVVGPVVDVKLIAMQVGTFGPRVAVRLLPLTFVVALLSAAVLGWWLL